MLPLARLWYYANPHRGKIWFATSCSVLNKFFDILPEVLIGIAVDVVVNQKTSFLARMGISDVMTQLVLLGILTLLIWALESAFQYLYSVSWRNLAQTLQHEMRLDAYNHVQRLEMTFFEDQSTGRLLSILNDDVNQLERFLDGGANQLLQFAASTVMVAVIFFYLSPSIAVFALLPIPVILFGAYRFQKRLGPKYDDVRERAGLVGARLANSITGMVTIKSFTAEDYEAKRLAGDSLAYQNANRSAIRVSSAFIPMIRMAICVGFVATTVLGGWYAIHGSLAVGSYSVLVFLTQRFLWPFTEMAQMTDLYQRAMASAKRVLDLLETPIGIKHDGKELPVTSVKGDLRFEHVCFDYMNGVRVLEDFSLHLLAGKTYAFVGATGAGKSTLIKLILRFYEAQKGKILLDGEDITKLSLQDVRRAIGFVSQDVFLFQGTIRENIAYGRLDASFEEIVQAAKVAEAHEFIMQLPQGYDTIVGERGQKLSGGQRQRLSIARAVLKNPPIFILDEATSAVDNETEAAIQRSLDKIAVGRTTIVIAHRLSTIRHAHQIIVMDAGKIAEAGKHEELVLKGGIYATLWRIQTGEGGMPPIPKSY